MDRISLAGPSFSARVRSFVRGCYFVHRFGNSIRPLPDPDFIFGRCKSAPSIVVHQSRRDRAIVIGIWLVWLLTRVICRIITTIIVRRRARAASASPALRHPPAPKQA
jgi:hypothetical protein